MSNVSNNPPNADENLVNANSVSANAVSESSVSANAVSARELISVCRQIGGMMEAGVDILRVTRVLRAQTKNPRLLEWYDQFDHQLTMGRGLPEALAQAPDLFSPFAVSLVRQGEERNDLSTAFLRVADFLAKEQETADRHSATSAPQVLAAPLVRLKTPDERHHAAADAQNFAPSQPQAASTDAPWWWRRAGLLGAGVLGALAVSEALVAAGWLDERWGRVARNVLSAGVLGVCAVSETSKSITVPTVNQPIESSITEAVSPSAETQFNDSVDEILPTETLGHNAPAEILDSRASSRAPQRVSSWDAEADTKRRIEKRPAEEEDFD